MIALKRMRIWTAALCLVTSGGSLAAPAFRPGLVMTGTGAPSDSPVRASAPPLSCLGAHDLNVQGGAVTLHGAQTFDRVCVVGGGMLIVDGPLTLRAGALYVDSSGRIDATPAGDPTASPPCQGQGEPGHRLTIVTRQATVLGPIVSNGAQGVGYEATCGEYGNKGGGAITLVALTLTLAAPISAAGGAGGAGTGSSGGPGGTITITVASPAPTVLRPFLHVEGGSPDPYTQTGHAGRRGPAGRVTITRPGVAQQAALPAPPRPLITVLGRPPARLSPRPVAVFSKGMQCGPADLDIGAGGRRRLDGIRRYRHICLHDGGVLQAGAHTTLVAQTILVDARSRIVADGVITATRGGPATGRYADGGVNTSPRATPHAGVPGAQGADSGANPDDGTAAPGPRGGAGGGSLTLIAHRILVAGLVSANGADGGNGGSGGSLGNHTLNYLPTGNAGGGSGGGIRICAADLQLTGTITVVGGNPGRGGDPSNARPHGSAGFVALLVDTLYAPPGDPAVAGPAALGHTLPGDSVPPPAAGSPGMLISSRRYQHRLSR